MNNRSFEEYKEALRYLNNEAGTISADRPVEVAALRNIQRQEHYRLRYDLRAESTTEEGVAKFWQTVERVKSLLKGEGWLVFRGRIFYKPARIAEVLQEMGLYSVSETHVREAQKLRKQKIGGYKSQD